MAKGRTRQQKAEAEAKHTQVYEDSEPATGAGAVTTVARSSRFKEATMNSTMSIHAPPDELWKGLDIENMIKGFNEENSAPVSATGIVVHKHARTKSASYAQNLSAVPNAPAAPAVAPASEGPFFGRIWKPISTFFNGAGASFSALGKRKAGSESAETKATEKTVATDKDNVVEKPSYDSKEDVEAAYHRAKEQGLMPVPKVFIRPVSRARKNVQSSTPDTPTPTPSTLAPPKTPTLYKSPSKKDLHKQKKLSKRVSELELKLASARKELSLVLASPNAPPVPSIPANLPSPPMSNHFSENETSPHSHAGIPSNLNSSSKIVKKRKMKEEEDDDEEYKPSDNSEPTPSKKLKRKQSSRLLKKKKNVTKEEVVIMVPDGVNVPPIPSIPKGVEGRKVAVRKDDGYGGFGDEMF